MEDEDLFADLSDEEEIEEPSPDPAAAKELQELQELREFKSQREEAERALAISEVFKEVGAPVAAAKLWAVLNDGDATPEAVTAFAAEYGLPIEKTGGGFTPTSIPSEGHVPAPRTWSKAEFEEGMRVNPGLWQRRFEQGKVRINNPQVLERRILR